MKTNLLIVMLIGITFLISSCAKQNGAMSQAEPGKTASDPSKLATSALADFKQVVTDSNFVDKGFKTRAGVESASLGNPTPFQIIGYDKLLNWSPGDQLDGLITASGLVYPVYVDQNLINSIVLVEGDGAWHLSQLGDVSKVEGINSLRQSSDTLQNKKLLEVPSFGWIFPSYSVNDTVYCTTVQTIPDLKLERGQMVEIQQLLSALSAYARDFDATHGDVMRQRKLTK